ncbi:hypothetical protein GOARA_052_00190 [Gordonia araii NBRC 100433]|uniref:Uncharacterized protein n=1 Tax=Gordonia araii NBRC 100433 TaxID=1073574 RepID=G7H2P5_9ACTN|nr:hypothetical protein [Gordonia araii]NNG98554.1 hypothetical protein [Gordonia araii NBRC 100433]GAB10120.1 hypothetical protein GOARA_052_00190 [Gordonia araii NBRC 100433]
MTGDRHEFSFIKLALLALGAGLAVLVVSLPLIWGAVQVHRWLGLAVALLAVVGIVAAIGVVANRVIDKAAEQLRHERESQPPADDR